MKKLLLLSMLLLPVKVFAVAATYNDVSNAWISATSVAATLDNGRQAGTLNNTNWGKLSTNALDGAAANAVGQVAALGYQTAVNGAAQIAASNLVNNARAGTIATAAAINVSSNNWLELSMFGGGAGMTNDVPFALLYQAALSSGKAWNLSPSPLHYFFAKSITVTNRGFKIFSFGNGTSVGSTIRDVPMVTLEFLASATNGIVLTEQSQGQQSDSGNIENVGVINNNPLGSAILFASTNGTSDGYKLENVSVQNVHGRGIFVQYGLSGSRFNNVTLENCGIGMEISTGGITQGDTFNIDIETCDLGMKLIGGNGYDITINHEAGANCTNIATIDNAQAIFTLNHVEWRDGGPAEFLLQGSGQSKIDFYGATENGGKHASWFLDDQSTTFQDQIYLNDLSGLPDTNINGAFPSIRVISSARQVVHTTRLVQEALYSGATLLRSNTVASPWPAVWQAADAGGFGMFYPYVDWQPVPPRLLMKYPTNANGFVPTAGVLGYAEPDLLQYDKDLTAANKLARLDTSNTFNFLETFTSPVLNSSTFKITGGFTSTGPPMIINPGNSAGWNTASTNIGGAAGADNTGGQIMFNCYNNTEGAGGIRWRYSSLGGSHGSIVSIMPNDPNNAFTPLDGALDVWFNRSVHVGGGLFVTNSLNVVSGTITGTANIATNIAGFGSWTQETITIGQSFTNKSGSRADLHINASHNDAVGSQPMMVISNFTQNIVWTNAVGALAATIPWSQDFPDWSTNDVGIIFSASTGTATETLVKTKWITK